jgi:hypothetical protein
LVVEPSLVVVVAAAVVEIVLALVTMIHLRAGHLQADPHKDRMDLDLDIDVVEHFEVIVVRAVIVVMN